jgi:hypothetical protein
MRREERYSLANSFVVRKRQITCSECSSIIDIPAATTTVVVKCRCGTTFEYNPAVEFQPYLTFEGENKQTSEYPLCTTVKIGRDENSDYLTITCQDDESIKQNIYLRNVYISRQHAKILIQEEFLLENKNSPTILAKKRCIIQDSGSTNGTSVNNRLLKPLEEKNLKHNDRVTLAPNSCCPVTFVFRER